MFYNATEAYQEDVITVSLSDVVDNIIIEEESVKGKLKVYPNPVENTLTVHIPNPNLEKATVRLISFVGQVVYQAETNESVHQIRVQNLNKGIYILSVHTETGFYTEKIIKR